jgi:hypothetical protein
MGAENAQRRSAANTAIEQQAGVADGALKSFQGHRQAVTREPGFGQANVGGNALNNAKCLKQREFYTGTELARRLLKAM